MLFQRSAAARFGGLKTLACYLAARITWPGTPSTVSGLRTVIAHDPWCSIWQVLV